MANWIVYSTKTGLEKITRAGSFGNRKDAEKWIANNKRYYTSGILLRAERR